LRASWGARFYNVVNSLSALQRAALACAGALVSPGGARGSLVILMYHRVLPEPDPLLADEPDARLFAAHMDVVRSVFNVLPLSEAVARLQSNSLPPRAACVTFDDGYANNFDVALPILAARKLPATVFVTTQFIGGGRMWNDTVIEVVRRAAGELDLTRFGLSRYALTDMASRRAALDAILGVVKYLEPAERMRTVEAIAAASGAELPNDLMASAEKLRRLHASGVEIGAHTLSHPILAKIADDDARREIADSKAILEDVIGAPVSTFAYPNGRPHQDYCQRHIELVRQAGFMAAVATARGCVRKGSDLFQLPRIAPWDRTAFRFAARMVGAYLQRSPALV
jgi:peptidoglycan/xylan/chitin deacetylase (PgdA/CDA1 family)